MLTKEQIQKEIKAMNEWIPISKIEENLGMPPTTLQKVLKGTRELPKKWHKKLEAYFLIDIIPVPRKNNNPLPEAECTKEPEKELSMHQKMGALIIETVNDEKSDYKKLFKPTKSKNEEPISPKEVKMKTFTELAYDAGLPVEIEGMVIQKNDKPLRENFKDGFEYSIALAEWKEKQSKSDKTK